MKINPELQLATVRQFIIINGTIKFRQPAGRSWNFIYEKLYFMSSVGSFVHPFCNSLALCFYDHFFRKEKLTLLTAKFEKLYNLFHYPIRYVLWTVY